MKVNGLYYSSIMSIILILLSISYAHAQTLNFSSSSSTTNPITLSVNQTLSLEKQVRQFYPNDAQTMMAINLVKNSSQFQSLVNGYNYTFDGIFEYLDSSSGLRIYAADFSLYKGPITHFPLPKGVGTVWLDPTLTKILNVTSSSMGWIGGPGGPSIAYGIESLCDKSFACYLRYFSIPPEAASICDTTLGCYIVGLNGFSDYLHHTPVPEFPIAIPILVISLASLLILYRIKFKIKHTKSVL